MMAGAGFAFIGWVSSYTWLLVNVVCISLASATYHPQASKTVNFLSDDTNRTKNMGLFSIGGGYAAMPMIQAKAVEYYHWLTMGEFTDLMTIAEMTPGPITVNSATFVGIRMAGIPGALVATMGCILPSLIIVSLLSWLYEKYRSMDAMQAVLACLRPAVVALIASAALTILRVVVFAGGVVSAEAVQMLYVALFAAALVVLRVKHSNPILVMVCCGAVSLIAKFIAG